MTERTSLSCTDTAKLIRKVLKESFPGHKFSVTCTRSAGSDSIDVRWTDGPAASAVDPRVKLFAGSYFDGMTDYRGRRTLTLDGIPVRIGADIVSTHRHVSKAVAESMVAHILAKPGRNADWLRIVGDDVEGCRVLQSPHGPNMSADIEEWERTNTLQPQESPTLQRVKLTGDDRTPHAVPLKDRLFYGVFPTGISYADRQREVAGDYRRLAFLSFRTLVLEIEEYCPAELRAQIEADAATIQAHKGQQYSISSSGQYVILGE